MTSSPSRARGARVVLSGLVLASTVFGTVLVPATANAATDPAPTTPAAAAAPASDVDAVGIPAPIVRTSSSDLAVAPLGFAEDAQWEDGTRYARSDLRQAGRWIRKGQQIAVTVPEGMGSVFVGIGQYGHHIGINKCEDVGVVHFAARGGETTAITAPHDGLVSVFETSDTRKGTVHIAGGYPVPTFVEGQTDRAKFDRHLREWTQSPFFLLIGERVQADVLRHAGEPKDDQNEELIHGDDLDARLAAWDDVVRTNADFWGARGEHRVHIATPTYDVAGSSEYADAHNGFVSFPTDHADPHGLLSGDRSQAGEGHLRHAIGQVFQQRSTRWKNGFGQADDHTSADLASLVIEERVNGRNWLDGWTDKVRAFRAKPIEQRDFWSNDLNATTRSLMFDQLRRAYGNGFVARTTARANEDGDRSYSRAFIRAAAQVTEQDLTRFFAEWGIAVDDDVRAEMATYPEPTTPIWDDFDALH
ncbi:M60 family metallopeptidase [Curtobacterium sp. ER1/6]|uniref:M60 family metallopeptidase n=1 Tax=Curtobacterium sp. ER1/6 TaxID=1891920 RepID=UPI00084FAC65|nr:M60 family metallopeptidase [Curtobacterium sp. ER1/6]OEI69268.1 hypothetical protein Cus16_1107 [Curtobacterium sp. ER1/6]